MRIIPKKTKVRMEFFKGVEVLDVLVGMLGAVVVLAVVMSNIPYRLYIAIAILILFVALIIPIDNEKAYMMVFNAVKYIARYKKFEKPQAQEASAAISGSNAQKAVEETKQKAKKNDSGKETIEDDNEKKTVADNSGKKAAGRKAQPKVKETKTSAGKKTAKKGAALDVPAITPFTGVKDGFIEYANEYYGIVVEIPSVEFRFYSVHKQDNLIDRVYGSVLRTVTGSETAAMVKIDRPMIYDEFIKTEEGKLAELKQAFVYGLLDENELTTRVALIYDRIETIKQLNFHDKVYVPFHYIVFFNRDKGILRDQAAQMVNGFASNDMECRRLDTKELAVFLKYNYTLLFDEREIEKLKPEQYMDWILPKSVEFTARMIKYDDLYTHTLRVKDYPTMVTNAWGHKLFNMPSTRVVLKMKPIDRGKAIRQIDRAIDELRNQEEQTGKTSKLMELSSHIDTLASVLALLQSDNETLFNVNVYVTIYDYELSERYKHPKRTESSTSTEIQPISFKKRIRRSLAEGGFKTTDLFMQQFEAYVSSMISARDCFTKDSRGIHSGSVAAAFPYVYKNLCDKGGVTFGRSGGVPVFLNFFQRDRERVNSNMVIIGKSGSGKSFATKTILSNLAAENSKIFILDPENEYQALATNLHGKIIDVGNATQGRMNPFHIITGLSDDEDDEEGGSAVSGFNMHLQFLEEFYRQILPGIDADALEYLNNLTVRMYEAKGIDQDTDLSKLKPEDYPIFDDLYDKILNDYQFSSGEYSKGNLRVLMNYISKFSTGGRNSSLWNGEATIATNENFIVFNFQSLLANKNNTIANAQMLLVLKWLDNEIIKNRDYNIKYQADRKIIVVIDEAHVFIDAKYPIALDFMFQLAKRIRKYNGMQIIITQNIKDFVGTEELARKSTAIINACQYSFIFPLAPNDMHDLCKLYEKAGSINESEQEEIINNGRGRAFVVTSPSNRTCIDIVATEEIQRLFTM